MMALDDCLHGTARHGGFLLLSLFFLPIFFWISRRATNTYGMNPTTHPYFNIAAAAASGKEDSDTDGISR
jgi:hypothetical protein